MGGVRSGGMSSNGRMDDHGDGGSDWSQLATVERVVGSKFDSTQV